MIMRHNGYCQACKREIEVEIEYIETSDLTSASHTYIKGLATCRERNLHSNDECKGCKVAATAPETYCEY